MKRMINMTKKYDKDDKTDDKYDKNNDKGARKIIKMIKKHDKDDNNDGMGSNFHTVRKIGLVTGMHA